VRSETVGWPPHLAAVLRLARPDAEVGYLLHARHGWTWDEVALFLSPIGHPRLEGRDAHLAACFVDGWDLPEIAHRRAARFADDDDAGWLYRELA